MFASSAGMHMLFLCSIWCLPRLVGLYLRTTPTSLDYVLTACVYAARTGTMSLLLALPEPCLLAVLQYCASDDLCSVFSAARAHSKLHQALRSIRASMDTQNGDGGCAAVPWQTWL